jgi:predicted alpha/beta hydrolase
MQPGVAAAMQAALHKLEELGAQLKKLLCLIPLTPWPSIYHRPVRGLGKPGAYDGVK